MQTHITFIDEYIEAKFISNGKVLLLGFHLVDYK